MAERKLLEIDSTRVEPGYYVLGERLRVRTALDWDRDRKTQFIMADRASNLVKEMRVAISRRINRALVASTYLAHTNLLELRSGLLEVEEAVKWAEDKWTMQDQTRVVGLYAGADANFETVFDSADLGIWATFRGTPLEVHRMTRNGQGFVDERIN